MVDLHPGGHRLGHLASSFTKYSHGLWLLGAHRLIALNADSSPPLALAVRVRGVRGVCPPRQSVPSAPSTCPGPYPVAARTPLVSLNLRLEARFQRALHTILFYCSSDCAFTQLVIPKFCGKLSGALKESGTTGSTSSVGLALFVYRGA